MGAEKHGFQKANDLVKQRDKAQCEWMASDRHGHGLENSRCIRKKGHKGEHKKEGELHDEWCK